MRQDDKRKTEMLKNINALLRQAFENLADHRKKREDAHLLIKTFYASVETDVEDDDDDDVLQAS